MDKPAHPALTMLTPGSPGVRLTADASGTPYWRLTAG